jgi:hypothetical protein
MIKMTFAENGDMLLSPDDNFDPGVRDLYEALEAYTCNGWNWIPPEAIGALTDAPILSQDLSLDDSEKWAPPDNGAPWYVYAHTAYMTEDPIDVWRKGDTVRFSRFEGDR